MHFSSILKGSFSCQKLSQNWQCDFKFKTPVINRKLEGNSLSSFSLSFRYQRFSKSREENKSLRCESKKPDEKYLVLIFSNR